MFARVPGSFFMRFLIRFILFLLVLVAIAYAFVWFYASSEVKQRLKTMADRSIGTNTSLQFDNVEVTGFPLAFDVDFTNLTLESQKEGIFWQAPTEFGASYSILSPLTLSVEAAGQHLISGVGANQDLPPVSLNLVAKKISASLGFDQKIKKINVDIPAATINVQGLGNFLIEDLDFNLATPSSEGSTFAGNLKAFEAPEEISSFTSLKGVTFNGFIKAGLPKSVKKRHIAAWQQAGGEVDIKSFKAEVTPLNLDGLGTISLSQSLQPNVRMTTYAQNFDEMLNKAIEFGFVPEDKLSLIQLGSVMFKRPARSGQGNEMVLPLQITNGDVSFGPLKLVSLPAINWPN